jgi:hypothetical protein
LFTSFSLGSCSNKQESGSAQVNNDTQFKGINNQPVDDNLNSEEVLINGFPVRYVYSNTILYDNVDDLEKHADLIIIGKTATNFEDIQVRDVEESKQKELNFQPNQSILIKDSAGLPVGFFTISSVKVNKVLKGSIDLKEINVIQAGAVSSDGTGKEIIIANKGFTPLQKNVKYILFLRKTNKENFPGAGDNTYGILSINQGKFNLDQKDTTESKEEFKNAQYKSLKSQVSGKYKKDYDASPE